jgi:hypothetical protein
MSDCKLLKNGVLHGVRFIHCDFTPWGLTIAPPLTEDYTVSYAWRQSCLCAQVRTTHGNYGGMEVQLNTFIILGSSPRYPFDRRLGGLQSRSGCSGERKFRNPAGEFNLCGPASSLLTILEATVEELTEINSPPHVKFNFVRVTQFIM